MADVLMPDDKWPFLPLTAFMSMIAGYITLFLALPAYLVLRRRVRPTMQNVIVTGGLIGAVLPLAIAVGKSVDTGEIPKGEVPSEMLAVVGVSLPSGLVGGFAFWLCAASHSRRFVRRVSA
jgi:hypothetical protein